MQSEDVWQAWAMQKAQQIVMSQGYRLMEAAQRLDKKTTADSSFQLREAIAVSLIEAIELHAKGQLPMDVGGRPS